MASSIQGVTAVSAAHDAQPLKSGAAARLRVAADPESRQEDTRRGGAAGGHSTCLCYQCQAALAESAGGSERTAAASGSSAGSADYTDHLKKSASLAQAGLLAGGYRWFHQTAEVGRPVAVVDDPPGAGPAAAAVDAADSAAARSASPSRAWQEARVAVDAQTSTQARDRVEQGAGWAERGERAGWGPAGAAKPDADNTEAGRDAEAGALPGEQARKAGWQVAGDGRHASLIRTDAKTGSVVTLASVPLVAATGTVTAAGPAGASGGTVATGADPADPADSAGHRVAEPYIAAVGPSSRPVLHRVA